MTGAQRTDAADSPPPKEDPEAFVLRGRPRPVVRFRRGFVIGAAGALCAGLVIVTWLALEPPSFRMVADQETVRPAPDVTPAALADAPASYGDVPRLGPPLPGDLGRAILDHQRSLEAAGPDPGADNVRAAAEQAAIDRQRRAAMRDAARASAVLVRLGGDSAVASTQQPPAAVPVAQAPLADAPSGSAASAGQQGKIAFMRSAPGVAIPGALAEAPSPWTLSAGTIIPASLVTGLNSDLPGLVLAQVTEHVRDSATGRTVLIPQGSRLLGRYDSVVAFGQRRALLAWERIILPDGSSIDLDTMPATDLSGYAGLEDKVDFHTWRLIKGIALSTLLGVGAELSFGDGEGDLVRAIREGMQTNAARAGDRITERNLDVQPTLTVRPGWPVRAVVHKDLVLRPWEGHYDADAARPPSEPPPGQGDGEPGPGAP